MGPETRRGEPTLVEILIALLRERRVTFGFPILLATLTAVVVLLLPRQYTATASFIPQRGQSQLGRLAGLAAQFGVAVPGDNPAESSDFYADLATSREVLTRLVDDTFPRGGEGKPATLATLLGAEGDTPEAVEQDAVRRLRRRIDAGTDPKTGVVSVRVGTRWPRVSEAIVAGIVAAINDFDLHTRQSAAAAERAFVEGRLNDAKSELEASEDRLEAFSAGNRDYRNSPALQLRYDRLSRAVTLQQQVVTTLRQDYEQARIDEVRNTPRITVVEHAIAPTRPDSRRVALRVALALLVGMCLGWPVALIAHFARRGPAAEDAEWSGLLAELRAMIPFRWRVVHRGRPSASHE